MFDESRTTESNTSLNEREITAQSVVPRRYVRVKSKPQWMRNNEYVFSQVKIPDWKSNAKYTQSLTTTVQPVCIKSTWVRIRPNSTAC